MHDNGYWSLQEPRVLLEVTVDDPEVGVLCGISAR
jgi:hypothetical protein